MPLKTSYSSSKGQIGPLFQPTLFKKNLSRFWPFMLIYLIYLIMLYPMALHMELSSEYYSPSMAASEVVARFLATIREPFSVFIVALVMALAVFGYLYQNRSANMIHAFPVTRTQLFVTNYVSGLAMMVAVQFICALMMNLVILGSADGMLWAVWVWFGMTVAESIFFYSFACLMVMFTGQLLAGALFYMIWNFVYVAVILLVQLVSSLFAYGITMDMSDFQITPLCPLWYMSGHIGFVYNSSLQSFRTEGTLALVVFVAAAVVFAGLALYIYQRRRIECAGDFLSMKWTAPVFRWGVVLIGGTGCALIFTYMLNTGSTWNGRIVRFVTALVIAGAVLFFASEMFIEKSMRVFHKRIVRECAVCIAVLLAGVAMLHFDVFGIESYVPQTEEISNVMLAWQDQELVSDSPEKIEQLRQLHELLISDISEQKSYTNGDAEYYSAASPEHVWLGYMTLRYEKKDGSVVSRQYSIATENAEFSNELERQLTELFSDAKSVLSATLGYNYQDMDWKVDYASLSADIELEDDPGCYSYEELAMLVDPEKLQTLFEAVCADIDAGAYVPDNDPTELNGELQLSFLTREEKSKLLYAAYSNAGYRLGAVMSATGSAGTTAYVDLNVTERCTHTLEALISIGAIEQADDLRAPR